MKKLILVSWFGGLAVVFVVLGFTQSRTGYSQRLVPTRLSVGALAAGGSITQYRASLEKTQCRGWDVLRLSNGLVSLLIAPDVGGQAIQLQLGNQDFFFVNSELAGKVLPRERNCSTSAKTPWWHFGLPDVKCRGAYRWPAIWRTLVCTTG
jgi:hypothetical protein